MKKNSLLRNGQGNMETNKNLETNESMEMNENMETNVSMEKKEMKRLVISFCW